MLFLKREINNRNDKNFQSNLILYKLNGSLKIEFRTLEVNWAFNSKFRFYAFYVFQKERNFEQRS